MIKNLSPPAVHHQGRPKHSLQYQASMLRDAAAHVRLSPSASALLVYYGTQAERFRPSLKLIKRVTGIPMNKVSENAKNLLTMGLSSTFRESWSLSAGKSSGYSPSCSHRENRKPVTPNISRERHITSRNHPSGTSTAL